MEEFPDNWDDVEYYEWGKVRRTVKKIIKSDDAEEVNELFNEQVKILKWHIFVKRTENTHYNRLKENLRTNEFIIHVHYSQNYKDRRQGKIQSGYFLDNSFSIFTACWCGIGGTLLNENFTVTSQATGHSWIEAFSCINLIIHSLKKRFFSQFNNYQLGSAFAFLLMNRFNPDYTIKSYYKKRHHGQGPIDGAVGTVKSMIFQQVK